MVRLREHFDSFRTSELDLLVADAGAPFTPARTAIKDDGTATEASGLNGYTIVQADSREAATAFADGYLFLSDGNGKFTLEIFELGDT